MNTPAGRMTAAANALSDDLRRAFALCRDSVVAIGVFSLAINLLWLVPSLYMLQVYDRVLSSASVSTLVMLSLIALFLYATMASLEWVRSQILVRLSERMHALLADRLFDVSFRQSLVTGGQQSGAQPVQDLQALRQFLTGPGLPAFFDAPWMPLYAALMFAFHPAFGWLAIAAAIVLTSIAVLQERLTRPQLQEANRHAAVSQAALGRTLRNAEAIEAMGMLASLRLRWQAGGQRALDAQTLASERGGLLLSLSRVARLSFQSAVLGVGAWLVLDQQMTGGLMIAGSILLSRALAPIEQLTSGWRGFVAAREQFARLNEWLKRVPAPPERMSLPVPVGRLDVEGVTVVPPGANVPALRGVSFQLPAGEVLGIVGPSAAGKSTLARTLLGVWPAMQGRVRLDGADIYGWDRAELGPHLGYLPQDVELFDGSIAENIARFGEVEAEQVVAAARLAGVHEMVLRMPQGYDTVIGAVGGILTGGQRQRVGLARAVYGLPKLVVLDEPNSSLDEAGDRALVEALKTLKENGTTVVVISHRSSVLPAVDRLLALQDGLVVAFGPRDEVRRKLQEAQQGAPRASHVVALRPPGAPESGS